MVVSSADSLFSELDADGNGFLTFGEISSRLHDAGLTEEDIERLIVRLDTDSDGQISKEEFKEGFLRIPQLVGLFGTSEGEQNFAQHGEARLDMMFTNGARLEVPKLSPMDDFSFVKEQIAAMHRIPALFQRIVERGTNIEVADGEEVLVWCGRPLQLQVVDRVALDISQSLPERGSWLAIDDVAASFSYQSWPETINGQRITQTQLRFEFPDLEHPSLGREYSGLLGSECVGDGKGTIKVKAASHSRGLTCAVDCILEERAQVLSLNSAIVELKEQIPGLQKCVAAASASLNPKIEERELELENVLRKKADVYESMADWQKREIDDLATTHVRNRDLLKAQLREHQHALYAAEAELQDKEGELRELRGAMKQRYGLTADELHTFLGS